MVTKILQPTDMAYRLAEIKTRGYATFPNYTECLKAVDLLIANGIRLGRNQEYYADRDCRTYVMEPNKSHKQQIADFVKDTWNL